MPKKVTKQELVNKINEKFYQIEKCILYNAFVGNGAGKLFCDTHLSMTGNEPSREVMRDFYEKEFLPKLNAEDKAEMLGDTINFLKYLGGEGEREIEKLKKGHITIQKLIRGCDTLEKLKMLRDLPILKEDDSECDCCDSK